jgi:hypothetical protein
MSGNVDTNNNINTNSNTVNTSSSNQNDNADQSSVDNARDSISNARSSVTNSGDTTYTGVYTQRANNRRYSYGNIRDQGDAGFIPTGREAGTNNQSDDTTFTGVYTQRANNRRYSYANIRQGDIPTGRETGTNNQSDDTTFTGTYTVRGNNRRYSYAGIRDGEVPTGRDQNTNNQNDDTVYTGTYTVRANNRRYSYGGIRPGDDNLPRGRDPNQTFDVYTPSPRFSAGVQKNIDRTRRMTAKDFLFHKQDRNAYSYGTNTGVGQLMSKDEALDSLFYSDVANALMDNGFGLSRSQQRDIDNYQHEFSDEFASFDNVRSDLLYTQAAIVDALINNGAFLTPEQETLLGIDGSLTES